MIKSFTKQPRETYDFDFDFTDWLLNRNDVITSATVTGDTGITLDSAFVIDGRLVKIFASGGTHGQKYLLTCIANTQGGRIVESEMIIQVKEISQTV